MNVLVIGAGQVGLGTAIKLLRHPDITQVVIADADYQRAESGARRITRKEDHEPRRCLPLWLDTDHALDGNILAEFPRYGVIISAIPARYSPRLARLSVQARRPFCEFGGVPQVARQMHRELFDVAFDAGIPLMISCGFMPGIGSTMAALLVHHQPDTHEIVIYVGGLPQKPQPPHFYQRIFSVEGLLEIMEPATILRDGAIIEVEPCSGGTTLQVPALERFGTPFGDVVQTRITAGADRAPEVFQKLGLLDYREETVRWDWPALLRYIGSIPKESRVVTLERDLPPTDREHRDVAWLRAVAHNRYRTASYELCCPYDEQLGISAMAKVTGFSVAVVARLAGQGRLPAGVFAPEELQPELAGECVMPLVEDLGIRYFP